MTVVYDDNLNIVDIVNPLHCMLLQLSESDLIGKDIGDLNNLTDKDNRLPAAIIAQNVRKAHSEKQNVYFEYTTIHKDSSATSSACFAEWGRDGWIYVHVVKIDEENIFEVNSDFSDYALNANTGNLTIGVGIRHVDDGGNRKYILFNNAAKEFFDCGEVIKSPYWNQKEDDEADSMTLEQHDPLKMEKVIRDDNGNIRRWAIFTKNKIKSRNDGYYIITTMVDITKRRHKEILLEQQFTLLDMMYKNLPVGIIVYDKNGALVTLNQKNREIMGIPKDVDLKGLNLFKESNLSESKAQMLREGHEVEYNIDYSFEYDKGYFPTRSSGTKPLFIKIAPIKNKGSVEGYLLINQDMTEFMLRDRQLEQTSVKLRTMFNSVTSGIGTYDRNGILTDCNEKGLEILGLEQSENLYEKKLSFFRNPNFPAEPAMNIQNGNEVKFEMLYDFDKIKELNYYETSRRGKIYIEVKGAPMLTKDKKLTGYVFEINDITRIKEQERKLNELHDNLKEQAKINDLILCNITSGLIYLDADTNVIWTNLDSFGKDSNLSRYKDFIEGNRCRFLKNGQCNLSDRNCLVSECVKTKTIQTKTFPSSEFWLTVCSIPVIGDSGEVTSVLYKIDDITEQQRINIELRKAKEKAEQSDRLKSAFLANMSHEIRTPLNAIVGFSSLLATCDDADDKAAFIKTINSSSETLLRLINDILDLSKIESGMIGLNYEKFDMAEAFNSVFDTYSKRLSDTNVEFIGENPYSECVVCLDRNRLTQVGNNFITNAVKYTPSGHIRMGYRYVNDGVKIYVEDTGIGIPKEKHDRVFERFEKLDEFAQGTGLGLSICKAIVGAMHGDIGFTSEQGKGSLFWAWFPTAAEIKAQ